MLTIVRNQQIGLDKMNCGLSFNWYVAGRKISNMLLCFKLFSNYIKATIIYNDYITFIHTDVSNNGPCIILVCTCVNPFTVARNNHNWCKISILLALVIRFICYHFVMTPLWFFCIIKCYTYLLVYIMFNECKTRLTSDIASALPLVSNPTNKLTMTESLDVLRVELAKQKIPVLRNY